MSTETFRLELDQITKVIIQEPLDYLELNRGVDDLLALFEKASGFNTQTAAQDSNIELEQGVAIGAKWAALCVKDMMRTRKFLRGINKAISDRLKSYPDEPVRVLYTGTGPFATLLLPLTTQYSPDELQIFGIEVNQETFKHVQKVIQSFGSEAYFYKMECCDATTVHLSLEQPIHILVTECLQRALEKEPQVAILANLLPQLNSDVVLIPEAVDLHVGLLKSTIFNGMNKAKAEDGIVVSKSVFNLTKKEILNFINSRNLDMEEYSTKHVSFSKADIEASNMLAILTKITTYDEEMLDINESGLTVLCLRNDINAKMLNEGLRIFYEMSNSPKLRIEVQS